MVAIRLRGSVPVAPIEKVHASFKTEASNSIRLDRVT